MNVVDIDISGRRGPHGLGNSTWSGDSSP